MVRSVLVLMMLIAAAGSAAAQEDTVNVWQRASRQVAAAALYIPGSTDITVEMSQSSQPAQVIQLVEKAVQGGGAILVSVTQSGQIAPPSREGSAGKAGEGQPDLPVPGRLHQFSPFLEEVQASVQVGAQTQRSSMGTKTKIYALKWTAPDGTVFDGTIAIVSETGSPLRIDAAGKSSNPAISELELTMLFTESGSAALPSAVQVRQSGRSGLFATVKVSTNIRYSGYFKVDRPLEVRFTNLPNAKGM